MFSASFDGFRASGAFNHVVLLVPPHVDTNGCGRLLEGLPGHLVGTSWGFALALPLLLDLSHLLRDLLGRRVPLDEVVAS